MNKLPNFKVQVRPCVFQGYSHFLFILLLFKEAQVISGTIHTSLNVSWASGVCLESLNVSIDTPNSPIPNLISRTQPNFSFIAVSHGSTSKNEMKWSTFKEFTQKEIINSRILSTGYAN